MKLNYWIVFYVLISFLTYGHAYHKQNNMFEYQPAIDAIISKSFGAFFSAAFWPLYWSVELWNELPPESE